MSFSDYYETYTLDLLLDKTLYLGLSTANPTDDNSGLAEPSGNAYARVTVIESDWAAAVSGSKDNGETLTFPRATGSWGTVTHFAIFDAVTSGNMLIYGALGSS